ncbi:tetratricopeptide repeat protein 29 isoform X2 [Neofelis nebulosa]|uniref:tetratricopeptide repeat protein 29 isoform X2 n=1 Tax=Neofelis nebulosa TaxID=61452 RepID=UPI00272C3AB5|nr:tetratricopeptide repeat protein 29 isoform X2 [Neofelis nebulosa]
MTALPPLPMTHPKLTSLARQKLPCFPSTIPRSQLIKEKDDIDHYLEVNFKGLSKEEVAAYRNSYKKNICVDMLRDGYHKSFTELFALMEKWDALQEAARVRSLFWLQRPLEEQPDKLGHFYHHLTRAEAAERKEYFEDVYNNLYALACYFSNSEDKWVRNHFYERCFKIAQRIKIDGGKKEAEAHAHMGLLFEEEGSDKKMEGEASYYLGLAHLAAEEYETALTVLNTYSKISIDLEDDLSLGRAYEAIAKVLQSQGKMPEAIKYLKKVVEIARNNFQSLDVVRASTMLGDIYNEKGYYNKASEYFQQAFDTTAELRNMRHVDETKVHYGIAKAHQIMLTINNYIESEDLTSLDYLLSWKENRSSIAPHPIIGGSRKPTMESLYQIPENSEELNGFPDNRKNET